jgi:hypothetical protein
MSGWAWFGLYYAVAGAGFGFYQAMWVSGRTRRNSPVASPVGQFLFAVLCAPLALAVALAFVWYCVLAALGLLSRL